MKYWIGLYDFTEARPFTELLAFFRTDHLMFNWDSLGKVWVSIDEVIDVVPGEYSLAFSYQDEKDKQWYLVLLPRALLGIDKHIIRGVAMEYHTERGEERAIVVALDEEPSPQPDVLRKQLQSGMDKSF